MGKDVILWLVLVIVVFVLAGRFAVPFIQKSQLSASRLVKADINLANSQSLREPVLEDGVVVAEILDEPLVYEGLTVTLEGRSFAWVTKRAFTVGEPGARASKALLVIAPNDLPNPEVVDDDQLALGDNTLVRVTGEVRILREAQLEQILGVDFDSKHLRGFNFDNDPVLVATSVEELD